MKTLRRIFLVVVIIAVIAGFVACQVNKTPDEHATGSLVTIETRGVEVYEVKLYELHQNTGIVIPPGIVVRPSLLIRFKSNQYTIPGHDYIVELRERVGGPVLATKKVRWDKTPGGGFPPAQFFLTAVLICRYC